MSDYIILNACHVSDDLYFSGIMCMAVKVFSNYRYCDSCCLTVSNTLNPALLAAMDVVLFTDITTHRPQSSSFLGLLI